MKKIFLGLLFSLILLSGTVSAKELESFAPMVKKVEATVVNVSTTQNVRIQRPAPFDLFREFFGEEPGMPRQQKDFQRQSLGSGVIISAAGYVLTNNHVVKDASSIKIKLYESKEEYDAKVIGKDPKIDIALLKIDAKMNLPFATLGDSDILEVGDWVIAIGNPFGLSHTVTKGIVSAKGRVIGSGPYDDFIQTDAPINFGNSGGPLFNVKGELVGINTAIVSGGQGIGFAIPINMIRNLLPQLEKGSVTRGWVGVRIQEMTKDLAESFGLDKPSGVLIAEVIKNSPAEKAGLKEGDILLELDGKKIDDATQVPRIVGNFQPGKKVKMRYMRDKKENTVEITVAKRDESEGAEVFDRLGMKLGNTKNGLMIEEVMPNSAAAEAGINAGDYIIKINNTPVSTVEQFTEVLSRQASGSLSTILVKTKTGNRFITVRMP